MKDKQSLNNIFGSKFFDTDKIMKDVKSGNTYIITLTERLPIDKMKIICYNISIIKVY